ncbi:MAG: 4'-phosphopantetheinyl transferase superfamily protein [Candidatus Binataceae bacterium]|jgi:phosphopantetheinyl transferase
MLQRERPASPSLHLRHDRYGRPLLYQDHEPSAIAVALSHSRAIAACAITDLGAIGIDVEFCANRPFEAIAAAAFGPAEQELVARDGLAAFYRIWTLREALAKAWPDDIAWLADGHDYFAGAARDGSWSAVIDQQAWMFWTGVIQSGFAFAVALAPRTPIPPRDTIALAAEPFACQAAIDGSPDGWII